MSAIKRFVCGCTFSPAASTYCKDHAVVSLVVDLPPVPAPVSMQVRITTPRVSLTNMRQPSPADVLRKFADDLSLYVADLRVMAWETPTDGAEAEQKFRGVVEAAEEFHAAYEEATR